MMNIAYSSKRLGGFLLAFFLLFGIITVASSTTQAQVPWWERNQDRRERRSERREDRFERRQGLQVARQQGYGYGLSVGAGDAQRGQSYSPQRSRYWRNADQGYDNDFGNRGQYRQVFRDAFEQGYREGYQRYAYNRRNRWPY